MRAFVFPGQGAQAIGMGRALAEAYPAARAVFDEVDEALSEPLSRLIWEGEAETLTLTRNAQPALMAATDPRSNGGQFFGPTRVIGGPPAAQQPWPPFVDADAGRRLWEASERLIATRSAV